MTLGVGLALLALLFDLGSRGARVETAHGGSPPSLHLNVRVHESLDPANLEQARETGQALLESVGIRLDWRECHAGDACAPPGESPAVVVLLLPFANPTHRGLSGQVVEDNRTRAATISVYVPVLADLARAIRNSPAGRWDSRLATLHTGHLVGLTIAHEIGHALLLPHASSGLMQPEFDLDDVRDMREARLSFTPSEGAILRCQLGPDPASACERLSPRRVPQEGRPRH
jgi:hypothetical protein